ncbi:MAG: choice-of-anchor L domain-containing protein, partial [Gemmobacter sp.]
MATGAELGYNTNASAVQMANSIFGDGVTVVSASYTGAANSSAIYSKGNLAPGVVPSETGVILSTGNVRDFTQSNGDPNRSPSTSTDTGGPDDIAQLNAIAGARTFDAAFLDVNFIPTADTMSIRFVFSSEEYPEFSSSIYNDLVFVIVNGQSVPVSFGNGQPGVTNINQASNSNLFVSNVNDDFNTEMDGFTLTLSLTMFVNPGVVNAIRIGIADVSDALYDSNLLIASKSVQTRLVAQDDALTLREGSSRTVDLLANDDNRTGGTLVITHINGVAVSAGSLVTLPTGQVVRLNADGTVTITTDLDHDSVAFSYTVRSSTGATDVGIVSVTTIPCFAAGTRILTAGGPVAVETLRPGDLVVTQDDGPQPLRWIGRRRVAAVGALAPVRIAAGTFGPHGRLVVSPQHRI